MDLSTAEDLDLRPRERRRVIVPRKGAAPGAGRLSGAQGQGNGNPQYGTPTVAWALRYAERGWGVFRLAAGSSVPLPGSRGVSEATLDPETVRRWWPPGSRLNIGATPPAGYVVVDLDPGGAEALAALDLVLPATARQRTPRGSHHVYRLPSGVELRQTVGEIAKGVDTRCHQKGYIVVEPSFRTPTTGHPGGGYLWEVPPAPGNISEAPAWLVEKLSERPRRDWRGVAGAAVTNGSRNNSLASLAGLLFRRLPAEIAFDLGLLWAQNRCSPPLPEREAIRTLESIAGAELRRRGAA